MHTITRLCAETQHSKQLHGHNTQQLARICTSSPAFKQRYKLEHSNSWTESFESMLTKQFVLKRMDG